MLYYLVDALPALLGSMATLWAVCSPRHWFLRSCVLAVLLLLFMLIPAYELLVAGCVQIAVIMGGITLWRKRRNTVSTADATGQPWRISLRNLLLFTVLTAVAMAVVASFPDSPWIYWLRWTWPGFVAGCVTLFGLWLVVGKTRPLVRWISAIAFVFVAAAAVSLASGLSWVTEAWTAWPYDLFGDLLSERVVSWMRQLFSHYLPVIVLGMGLLCAWLALFVKTGWFDPFGDLPSTNDMPTARFRAYIRGTWVVLTVAIALLPVTLLVKLASPAQRPADYRRAPRYFEKLSAANKLISEADSATLLHGNSLKRRDLAQELAKHTNAFLDVQEALHDFGDNTQTMAEIPDSVDRVTFLVWAHEFYADKTKDDDLIINSRLDALKLMKPVSNGVSAYYASLIAAGEQDRVKDLWDRRTKLSTDQRTEILRVLQILEANRSSWDLLLHNQRIEDENSGWHFHLHVILDDWLGNERYAQERVEYHTNRTKIRLMLLDLALLSYQEANGRLPDSLEELVPGVLKELPTDPYADGPLKYRRTDNGYTLYSVGPNKIDESGRGDDKTLEALMQPAGPTSP